MYSETYSRILWFAIEIHCASCIVMYPDVSWVYLTQRMKYMEAWLVHHLTPPCRQISKPDSGYIYTSCSRTYPAHLKHVSRISATYLNGCAKIHTWSSYPTCILHVSCMYPACILSAVPRYTLEPCILHVLHVSTCIWHAARRYVLWACIPHVSCMYPACIWHAKPGYIKIHQDTSGYIKIHQNTVLRETPPHF